MRLIDADALIAKAYIVQEPNGFIHSVVTERQIVAATTIEAELVRHSFWEVYSTSAYGGYQTEKGEVRWLPRRFYRCERCRKGSAIRSNYCPNCGAKMDGDDHDKA